MGGVDHAIADVKRGKDANSEGMRRTQQFATSSYTRTPSYTSQENAARRKFFTCDLTQHTENQQGAARTDGRMHQDADERTRSGPSR